MAHEKPSIEECIKRKFSKSLHKKLRYERSYFDFHPEWKSLAVDAFIDSSGYKSNVSNYESGMLYSDLKRLLDLVNLGIFKYKDIKDKIPKNDLRVMAVMVAKYPGWATVEEIASYTSESDLRRISRYLKDPNRISYSVSEDKFKSEVNAVPGLLEALEKILVIHDVHNA